MSKISIDRHFSEDTLIPITDTEWAAKEINPIRVKKQRQISGNFSGKSLITDRFSLEFRCMSITDTDFGLEMN